MLQAWLVCACLLRRHHQQAPHLKGSEEVQDEINVKEDVNDTLNPKPGALRLQIKPLQ
jgi:hypothetical protein